MNEGVDAAMYTIEEANKKITKWTEEHNDDAILAFKYCIKRAISDMI